MLVAVIADKLLLEVFITFDIMLMTLGPRLNLGTFDFATISLVGDHLGRAFDNVDLVVLRRQLAKACPIVMPLVRPGLSRLERNELGHYASL